MVTLSGNSAGDIAAAWSQIAELKPRLAPHVEMVEHRYRGEVWYVLADKLTSSHFRCTPVVQQFLALLDGEHSVAEAYAACGVPVQDTAALDGAAADAAAADAAAADAAAADATAVVGGPLDTAATAAQPPLQDEVLRLLAELQSSQLLLGGVPLESAEIYAREQQRSKSRWLRRLASPLAVQIPLLDPDRFLLRLLPWVKPLFSPLFLWIWLVVVALAGISAVGQWTELTLHWETRFLDPGNLLTLWLLYPLVKGLHELGHGFATRVWGGEVHEMGVMLLVFTPVPYVDASASSAFHARHQRVVVAAAGIMVELVLAAGALWLWSNSGPGLLRDLCLNVMVIGGVSTLLFNGNPLLRFDGYYVFTDLLEIPNLRARSSAYLGHLLKRHVLKLQTDTSESGGREGGWLLSYAILSGLYRLFISFTIAFFIAGKYFFIGASLAAWLLFSQLVLPVYRIFAALITQARSQVKLARLGLVSGGGLVLLLLLLFVIPVGDSDHAEGIINLPENAQIRSRADGFIHQVFKRNGQAVRAGEAILRLKNPELRSQLTVLLAREGELKLRHSLALSGERIDLDILKEEMNSLEGEIRELRSQVDNLTVLSPHDGVFAITRPRDLPGRYVHKGDFLAHVIDQSALTVRVVVPQAVVDRVLQRTRTIEVRLASDYGELLSGERVQEVPQATSQLPSASLGSRDGGDIAVDARDEQGTQAISPVFQLDVTLPDRAAGAWLGQGASVRFVYPREPLGIGWYRQARQLVLTNFKL